MRQQPAFLPLPSPFLGLLLFRSLLRTDLYALRLSRKRRGRERGQGVPSFTKLAGNLKRALKVREQLTQEEEEEERSLIKDLKRCAQLAFA
jgi:hypothetical protein